MLPPKIQNDLELKLSHLFNKNVSVTGSQNIAGGCINDSCKIETSSGILFVKWNNAMTFPNMFEMERKGLRQLSKTAAIRIPNVLLQSSSGKFSYLILEYIDSAPRSVSFWQDFGRSLATLHKTTQQKFGWSDDNYIGSLPQYNSYHENWIDFFIEMRLRKQFRMAYDNNLLNDSDLKAADLLYLRMHELIPEEEPALLHGDLWSGNFIEDENGNPCLVDPSVYFGHREVDLAMTHLFGGCDTEMYRAYHEVFPLQPGFSKRLDIHNLYPLLVHLNLFGSSYKGSIRSILNKFS
ncbi:MAG: phosphotransferase [Chitinophagales bacterium]|nr:phosphotransferase [Chitinophagales bacterium]